MLMNSVKKGRAWRGLAASVVTCLSAAAWGQAQTPAPPPVPDNLLRVCADPNNLPASNQRGEGYENKIAEAMARDMGKQLVYTWFPQRMGFVRMTLRGRNDDGQFKCDLIIGVPKGYELTATTVPWMHSTYAMAFRADGALAAVNTPDDLLKIAPAQRAKLRFGIFGRSPAADWLLKHDLFDQSTAYAPQSGDPEENPLRTVERDLDEGKIDVAMVWGPVAAALARRSGNWRLVPFASDADNQFDFEISMGLRFGEKPWKDQVERWISTHQAEIETILKSYRVPILALGTGKP